MVSNTLMHREYSSSYTAKLVIEKDCMYVENANRASSTGYITVDNLEPNPKNPIIAAFFRNIGYADQLGSGVRNLFKYSKYYSGQEPQFMEGDVFCIVVPLNEAYSFDFDQFNGATNETKTATNETKTATNETKTATDLNLSKEEKTILQVINENPAITQKVICEKTGISLGTIKRVLPKLQERGILVRTGNRRSGKWKITAENW